MNGRRTESGRNSEDNGERMAEVVEFPRLKPFGRHGQADDRAAVGGSGDPGVAQSSPELVRVAWLGRTSLGPDEQDARTQVGTGEEGLPPRSGRNLGSETKVVDSCIKRETHPAGVG